MDKRVLKSLIALLLALAMILGAAACGKESAAPAETPETQPQEQNEQPAENIPEPEPEPAEEPAPRNGKVLILYTSDVHCGIDSGFGYAGLAQIRENYEKQGYTTLLVDDGDSIQGELIGTLTKGETIVKLMNALKYDVAVPGNHDFDYDVASFLALTEKADFPYISCNFTYKDELVFPPYVIKEAAGIKIAFVGVTTPRTIVDSTPAYFQDENGEFVYGFMSDMSGEALYEAVQEAVDAARKEGADYVYVLGHLGMNAVEAPYTYADVIEHTSGIDVFLDGHSHDSDQVVMLDRDGNKVIRSACGTKLESIGYSFIDPESGVGDTGIWTWSNSISAPELLGIDNDAAKAVAEALKELDEIRSRVVAKSGVTLTINDPEVVDEQGKPIRMVRRAETNLADLCTDAILVQSGADIAVVNGGGIRKNIEKGDVTFNDIYNVFPYGNTVCVIEATGQQILDALEWGARAVPDENGGFLQVAGMSYEINVSVRSGCEADENGMLKSINGPRRVQNVKVGGEPIDPAKTYRVAGFNYVLLNRGDGHTSFDGAKLLQKEVKIDNQMLIDYIVDDLGGEIGGAYLDPYGQGRITIIE